MTQQEFRGPGGLDASKRMKAVNIGPAYAVEQVYFLGGLGCGDDFSTGA